jgi:flagellar hook-associated protein 2
VTAGNLTVTVDQATAGATVTGGSALVASTVITGANNTLDIEIDGVARTLTIADGTYSASGLATAVQTAIDATGGGATASLDGNGRLKLTTTHEGSAATLGVTGGAALAALGVSVTMPASVGIDGLIRIGTNPAVVVASAGIPGASISVPAGSGNLDLALGGGLRAGDATVAVVSTGDRSLGAVAAAINSSGAGVSASAVKVSDGAWVLQMSSNRTGSAGAITLDSAAFAGVGGLVQTSAAQDAAITIGSGAGAYTVTASGNTFSDILPGVSLTATAVSGTPVTVGVARNDNATADAVANLVGQANSLLTEIAAQTKYDPDTRTSGPLAGDSVVKRLAQQVRSAITSVVGGSTTTATALGIDTQRDGTLKFDRAKFLTAIANDPDAVERLFNRHGSAAGGLTWAGATDNTDPGTYAVEVTTAATRATTTIAATSWALGEVIGVRVGTTTISYDSAPGATATEVASGLNAALAAAGLKVNAEVDVTGVRLTAVEFGYSGNFETNLDVGGAGSWSANAGTDVQGTINGQTAIGKGQRLSLLDLGTSPARGIAVDVDEGLTGALGNVEYQPGIAARLVNLATELNAETGALTTTSEGYDKRVKAFDQQIEKFEERMLRVETNLRRQWSTIQSILSSLEQQGNWLSSQITSMTKSNSN